MAFIRVNKKKINFVWRQFTTFSQQNSSKYDAHTARRGIFVRQKIQAVKSPPTVNSSQKFAQDALASTSENSGVSVNPVRIELVRPGSERARCAVCPNWNSLPPIRRTRTRLSLRSFSQSRKRAVWKPPPPGLPRMSASQEREADTARRRICSEAWGAKGTNRR
jgi:hypothetical protein